MIEVTRIVSRILISGFCFILVLTSRILRRGFVGKREIFPVYSFPFVEIGMQVNFGRLDRGMPKVLLDDPEVLGPPVEFAGIAMTDLVRCNPRRCVFFKDLLHCPRRNMVAQLADKERAFNSLTDKGVHFPQRLGIDKNSPDLPAFPFYPDGMLFEIDVFDIDI